MIEIIGYAAVRKFPNGEEGILLHEIRPFGGDDLIKLLNRMYDEDCTKDEFPVQRIIKIAISEIQEH
jgi:hypothetical protein